MKNLNLTNDIKEHICSFFSSPKDALSMGQTCKEWRAVIKESSVTTISNILTRADFFDAENFVKNQVEPSDALLKYLRKESNFSKHRYTELIEINSESTDNSDDIKQFLLSFTEYNMNDFDLIELSENNEWLVGILKNNRNLLVFKISMQMPTVGLEKKFLFDFKPNNIECLQFSSNNKYLIGLSKTEIMILELNNDLSNSSLIQINQLTSHCLSLDNKYMMILLKNDKEKQENLCLVDLSASKRVDDNFNIIFKEDTVKYFKISNDSRWLVVVTTTRGFLFKIHQKFKKNKIFNIPQDTGTLFNCANNFIPCFSSDSKWLLVEWFSDQDNSKNIIWLKSLQHHDLTYPLNQCSYNNSNSDMQIFSPNSQWIFYEANYVHNR